MLNTRLSIGLDNKGVYVNLKIGRNNYTITKEDKFIDNGSCVMLLTQSKEKRIRWDSELPLP